MPFLPFLHAGRRVGWEIARGCFSSNMREAQTQPLAIQPSRLRARDRVLGHCPTSTWARRRVRKGATFGFVRCELATSTELLPFSPPTSGKRETHTQLHIRGPRTKKEGMGIVQLPYAAAMGKRAAALGQSDLVRRAPSPAGRSLDVPLDN